MRNLLLSAFICLFFNAIWGQNGNNVPDPPIETNVNKIFHSTPSVEAFQRYDGFKNVNLSTGRATVDIPIYTIKTGDIEYPIKVSYDTGGVKVDQEASEIGLGWTLLAGGHISKIVNDIDDGEFDFSYYHDVDDYEGIAGSHMYSINAMGYHMEEGDRNLKYNELDKIYKIDAAPDVYKVYNPILRGKFVILKNGSSEPFQYVVDNMHSSFSNAYRTRKYKTKNISNQGMKVLPPRRDTIDVDFLGFQADDIQELTMNYLKNRKIFDFNEFKILDKRGNQFDFEYGIVQESFRDTTYEGTPNLFYGVLNLDRAYQKQVNSWNLKKIKTIDNKEINFEYETYQKTHDEYIFNRSDFDLGAPNGDNDFETEYEFGIKKDEVRISNNFSRYKIPYARRLKKIIFDNGYILFDYNLQRQDVKDEKALTFIRVFDNHGKLIKKVAFSYSHIGTGDDDCGTIYCKRLFLDKIDVFGGFNSAKQTYHFEYDPIPLPIKKFSLEKDYLGYYNNNGSGNFDFNFSTKTITNNYTPELYFVPNQKEFSIIPFKRKDLSNAQQKSILGNYDLTPNIYSKAGSLIKITYPAGGSIEFEYENNQFYYFGYDYTAGGNRIKSQIIRNEDNEIIKKMNYEYNEGNHSSGILNYTPIFGLPTNPIGNIQEPSNNWDIHFFTFDRDRSNYKILYGNPIMYTNVKEYVVGKGKNVYRYTSNQNLVPTFNITYTPFHNASPPSVNISMQEYNYTRDFLINHSGVMSNLHFFKLIKPSLLTQSVYNENNQLLSKTDYNYILKEYDHLSIETHEKFIGEASHRYDIIDGTNYLKLNSIWRFYDLLPNTTITKSYFGNNYTETTKNLGYQTPSNNNLTFSEIISSDGTVQKTTYKYAQDMPVNDTIINMIHDNMIGIPLEVSEYKNNKLISKKNTQYYDGVFGLMTPKSVSSVDIETLDTNNEKFTVEITYDRYDSSGNLLQYTSKEGIPTAIVYGYHNTQPIAQIVGATYAQVEELISTIVNKSNLDTNAVTEQQLIDALDEFRKLPALKDYQITTYTYDPLIGVTSITPPSGIRQVYLYDEANRLKEVREGSATGKLLKAHEYHYKQ